MYVSQFVINYENFADDVHNLYDLLSENIFTAKTTIFLTDKKKSNEEEFQYIKPGFIGLQTSGTTGVPKIIWKNLAEVFEKKRGNGSSEDIWLLTYNPIRWAGLSVILHCIKNKCKLFVPCDLSQQSLLNTIDKVTHISLTPSLFRKLMILNIEKLKKANLKQVTFGGEWANQKVLDDAKSIWPNAKITHIYAATEFGDIFSCSDGYEGYPWSNITKNVYHGYDLLGNGELIINGKPTEDLFNLSSNRLCFSGRKTEIINVGGAKVSPIELESLVNGLDEIKECKVYPISNPLLGQVVGLDYVGDLTVLEIKKILSLVLPKYAIPLSINKVELIQLTEAGKISRS